MNTSHFEPSTEPACDQTRVAIVSQRLSDIAIGEKITYRDLIAFLNQRLPEGNRYDCGDPDNFLVAMRIVYNAAKNLKKQGLRYAHYGPNGAGVGYIRLSDPQIQLSQYHDLHRAANILNLTTQMINNNPNAEADRLLSRVSGLLEDRREYIESRLVDYKASVNHSLGDDRLDEDAQ